MERPYEKKHKSSKNIVYDVWLSDLSRCRELYLFIGYHSSLIAANACAHVTSISAEVLGREGTPTCFFTRICGYKSQYPPIFGACLSHESQPILVHVHIENHPYHNNYTILRFKKKKNIYLLESYFIISLKL